MDRRACFSKYFPNSPQRSWNLNEVKEEEREYEPKQRRAGSTQFWISLLGMFKEEEFGLHGKMWGMIGKSLERYPGARSSMEREVLFQLWWDSTCRVWRKEIKCSNIYQFLWVGHSHQRTRNRHGKPGRLGNQAGSAIYIRKDRGSYWGKEDRVWSLL